MKNVSNKILNLTQHHPTMEQLNAGVVNPDDFNHVKNLLNFNSIPTVDEINAVAQKLAAHAYGFKYAMIGGAPFLMGPLSNELKKLGVTPLFAFSQRVSKEKVVDGKVVKTTVFQHLGFVEN